MEQTGAVQRNKWIQKVDTFYQVFKGRFMPQKNKMPAHALHDRNTIPRPKKEQKDHHKIMEALEIIEFLIASHK